MPKQNPFNITINTGNYILGRYHNINTSGNTYFAVLINTKDGNRFIEPIEISQRKWDGLCESNPTICKETIQMIIDTSIRLRASNNWFN